GDLNRAFISVDYILDSRIWSPGDGVLGSDPGSEERHRRARRAGVPRGSAAARLRADAADRSAIRRCVDVQFCLALRDALQARRAQVDPGPLGREAGTPSTPLLQDHACGTDGPRRPAQGVASVLRAHSRTSRSRPCVTPTRANGEDWSASAPIENGASCRPTSSTSSPVTWPTFTPLRLQVARRNPKHGNARSRAAPQSV